MQNESDFKPSRISTDSRWPIGFYHWSVTTKQTGIDNYNGLDLVVTGVTFTLWGAKRQVRRVERNRNKGPRVWMVLNDRTVPAPTRGDDET